MIPGCLEQFDFPLCASKPGCELSKAASKAAAKNSERGVGRVGCREGEGGGLSLRAWELRG